MHCFCKAYKIKIERHGGKNCSLISAVHGGNSVKLMINVRHWYLQDVCEGCKFVIGPPRVDIYPLQAMTAKTQLWQIHDSLFQRLVRSLTAKPLWLCILITRGNKPRKGIAADHVMQSWKWFQKNGKETEKTKFLNASCKYLLACIIMVWNKTQGWSLRRMAVSLRKAKLPL